MTVDPTKLKQSYILVVSDEGATRIVGYPQAQNAGWNGYLRRKIESLKRIVWFYIQSNKGKTCRFGCF